MSKIKRINGEPENSVFAVKGELLTNDQGEVFIKKFDDRLNTGWVKMPAPQEIQFEKIVIEANSIGGLSNLSPTLRFQIPSGTAIIKIEAEVSSSVQTNIRVVLNGNTVINEANESYAEYTSNELNTGVHSVICTADTGVENAFVRLTITKVGGYGKPFIGAQALGEISSTKEVILKVFGTNYYSKGKARFFDVTTNSIAIGSDYEYNLQTDTINNPTDFIGGGTKVFMGKGAGSYEGRGRVEIADFGGDYIDATDLTQSLFWLEEPLQDKVTSSFLQGTADSQFYKLVNPNNFSLDVDYTITIPIGSGLTTGSGESNNYFKDNVLVLDGNSSTLGGLSTSSFTASYNGAAVQGSVLLEIGGVEGLYPLKYEQFVVPVTTTTTTPEPTTTTTPEPTTTTTTTTEEPTTTTTTTAAPVFNLSVNGGQPGIAGVAGSGEYAEGQSVTIEAFLLEDWVFNVWSDPGAGFVRDSFGNLDSGSNPGTIIMPAQNNLVATATATFVGTTTTTTTTEEPTTTTTTTPEPDCLEYTVEPADFLETYQITYVDCDGNPRTSMDTTAQNFCTRDSSSIDDTFGKAGSLATIPATIIGPHGSCTLPPTTTTTTPEPPPPTPPPTASPPGGGPPDIIPEPGEEF